MIDLKTQGDEMRRNPIYTFNDTSSTGISKIPLESVIQILDDGTGNPVILTLVSKTNVNAGTTIGEFLSFPDNYNEAGSDTSIQLAEKGAIDGVAPLGPDGKIPQEYLNTLSIHETFMVDSEMEMLALNAGPGDIAIRSDLSKTFIYNGGLSGTMTDWTELQASNEVTSVNSQIGIVVLNTDDINVDVGSPNQYYSDLKVLSVVGGTVDDSLEVGDDNLWSTDKINLEINTRVRGTVWGASIQYNIGDIVSQYDKAYICKVPITIPAAFNSAEWEEIGSSGAAYDDTVIRADVDANAVAISLKVSDVPHPIVQTAVPTGAVFTDTDTVYDDSALVATVATKVDQVQGKGLSTNDYTDAEKSKLATMEGSHFKGVHLSESALNAAHPTAEAGSYAYVSDSITPEQMWIWDDNNGWILSAGSGSGIVLTDADIKIMYERNPDTNALTDNLESEIAANTAKVSNVDHPTVETAVPLNALFTDTDTLYDDSAIQAEVDLNTVKVSNVDHPVVETAVPTGAIFTDTVYNDTALAAEVTLNTAKVTNVDHPVVQEPVPTGAVFTDTVYDDSTIQAEVTLNTAKVSNVDHPIVETAVPTGAVFTDTDTVYDDSALAATVATKVDQVQDKGLSTNDYTDAEKSKLANIEGSHFKGVHSSESALNTAHPTAEAGSYAYVTVAGDDEQMWMWDTTANAGAGAWELSTGGGSGTVLTDSDIKLMYERNPDTNALTDNLELEIAANTAKVSNVDHPIVETAVPTGAVFTDTDTVYDDSAIQAEVDLNTLKVTNVDHPAVETAVPTGAVFTDTVYDDTAIQAAVTLNTAKLTNVDHPLVETAVPTGAVFTDTVYDDTALAATVATKVDQVQDKGLSTNDYTDADKALVNTASKEYYYLDLQAEQALGFNGMYDAIDTLKKGYTFNSTANGFTGVFVGSYIGDQDIGGGAEAKIFEGTVYTDALSQSQGKVYVYKSGSMAFVESESTDAFHIIDEKTTDLDTLRSKGLYYVDGANMPPHIFTGYLEVKIDDDGTIFQTVTSNTAYSSYKRRNDGPSAWDPWEQTDVSDMLGLLMHMVIGKANKTSLPMVHSGETAPLDTLGKNYDRYHQFEAGSAVTIDLYDGVSVDGYNPNIFTLMADFRGSPIQNNIIDIDVAGTNRIVYIDLENNATLPIEELTLQIAGTDIPLEVLSNTAGSLTASYKQTADAIMQAIVPGTLFKVIAKEGVTTPQEHDFEKHYGHWRKDFERTYDYEKIGGPGNEIIITSDTWVNILDTTWDERSAGLYEYKQSITYNMDVPNRSVIFRFSLDGGVTWEERSKEVKDAANIEDTEMFFPFVEVSAFTPHYLIEARVVNTSDTCTIIYASHVLERKG